MSSLLAAMLSAELAGSSETPLWIDPGPALEMQKQSKSHSPTKKGAGPRELHGTVKKPKPRTLRPHQNGGAPRILLNRGFEVRYENKQNSDEF
jgi:hypothetical protein